MPTDQPLVFVIFGATGDLAHRKLIPALYRLRAMGLLGEGLTIIGVGRRDLTDSAFRDDMRDAVAAKVGASFDAAVWEAFSGRIHYVRGDFGDPTLYAGLASRLSQFDAAIGACVPRFFYLATPPEHYETILTNLHDSKLAEGCGHGTVAYTRVLIEKPFGKDLATAERLDILLSTIFEERQIFRIDHYLGLETVQNILAFRFANGIFEPMWNHTTIDHVEITFAESVGVDGRGAFYDGVGALRDVAQNHMFEMLSLIAMEPPKALDAKSIHDAKAALMRSVVCPDASCAGRDTVRGQYEGYLSEPGVVAGSDTETYVAFKVGVSTPRWKGVPFYLRAGKKLAAKDVEISVHFRKPPCSDDVCFFRPETVKRNVLVFRIQPYEGIALRLMAKQPGFGMAMAPVIMQWEYATSFGGDKPDAYERLLADAVKGDQTLFARTDAVLASWALITRILDGWRNARVPVHRYAPGSMGPSAADDVLAADGRAWYLHRES